VTNSRQIKLTYPEVADDGGAPVQSYELQQASPLLNDWMTLVGGSPYSLSLEFLQTNNITSGSIYAYRYRAINEVGVGPWSVSREIRAAGLPSAPARPVYASSTATSVTLTLSHTGFDNGGSEITSFKLLRDAGNSGASNPLLIATQVSACDGHVMSCEVTGLTSGVVYRF
jgi:hypothetical protein